MKNIKIVSILILILANSLCVLAQEKYFTREGYISFHSDTEVETIHADNYKVTSVLDLETGKMEFAVLMKAFEFEKALMEEHFNENYVESDKYPKAVFKGSIVDFSSINLLKDGEYKVKIKGSLSLHGVTKEIIEEGTFTVADGAINGYSKFMIAVADYDISIPKVVIKNIAENVQVEVKMTYQKLTKS